ncbi:complement component C7-like [Acipenser ruthenus]|uniref:complement component C7-like n=1 Tax=Acipenser ruthenus TaxID=7906 RepID=UPI0027419DB2|nr:complement component C7-like [Acipenser ruthenus]
MKVMVTLVLYGLAGLLHLIYEVGCVSPVNCQWTSYSDWSECDGCTKTQTRRRTVLNYGQYGGSPCSGEPVERRACVPTRGCPIEDGCGGRFRCSSGQCISRSLVCNGDQDCEEDGSDEQRCEEMKKCDKDQIPPKAELSGAGFDILKGKVRNNVINTKSFGGQCRIVFSGDHRYFYRLTQSLQKYTFQVKIKNDFSYEFYNSTWSYNKHTSDIKRSSHDGNYDHTSDIALNNEKSHQLMIIRNEVEVAQFINSPPEFLTLSEVFWKDLSLLPVTYEYGAYRKLIESYGTHFIKEGSLGGLYKLVFYMDSEKMNQKGISNTDAEKCTSSSSNFIFVSVKRSECNKLIEALKTSQGYASQRISGNSSTIGGSAAFSSGLNFLDLNNPAGNSERYASWAGSVKDNPSVIKQKLTPLHELVKEVACASVKRYNLKQAIEQYLNENHPCNCKPCQNNGLPVIKNTQCNCDCKPGTSGLACEKGTPLEEQPGVIDGSWSCWSSWSFCSRGQRSRGRKCDNPSPSGGGKSCIGEHTDSKPCEDEEVEYLREIEPHCFDTTLVPVKSCQSPPPLINGFVQDPKDLYPVGSKIVYSCIEGYYVVGDPVAKCGEDLHWQRYPLHCHSVVCGPPTLQSDITGTPWKTSYEIGEKITLSCPPAKKLEGASEIMCDSSLNWSPKLTGIQCKTVSSDNQEAQGGQCQPWQKKHNSECVCKMPYECKSSLDICVTNAKTGRTDALTVCKVYALECLGRSYTPADESTCKLPGFQPKPCPACQLWEKCDEQTNICACRGIEECKESGSSICVLAGENHFKQTMSECEAGARRCRGENISVVNIRPCEAQE